MYILLFMIMLILALVGNRISKRSILLATIVPVTIVTCLRYGVGADYFSYMRIYLNIGTTPLSEILSTHQNIDLLFKLLIYIPAKIGVNYHVFSSLIIIVFFMLVMKWIAEFPIRFEVSMLLYISMLFIYWNLSALRQGIVIFVSLYVYFNGTKEFSIKQKLLTSLVMVFMHKSAVIVPIVYFTSKIKWTRNLFILFLFASPLSRLLLPLGVMDLLSKLPLLSNITRYVDYNSISYFSAPSIMRLGFIVIVLVHYNKLKEKYPNYKLMFNFSLISLIGYFYLPLPMVVGTRTTIFGYFLLVIILPMILEFYELNYQVLGTLALLSISSVSFANEFIKLVDRSGYNRFGLLLNIETVFNSDYTRFNNSYALKFSVDRDNKNWYRGSELEDKVNATDIPILAPYSSENSHFTVYFPFNGRYGIINDKGELVYDFFYEGHRYIIDNYRVMTYETGPFDVQSYENFTNIPSTFHNYEEIKVELESSIKKINDFAFSSVVINELDKSYLSNFDILSGYDLNSVLSVEDFTYLVDSKISYIRFLTKSDSYYLVLRDGKLLVDRVFDEIEIQNSKGIIVGYTSTTKEYITRDGSVVWYEVLSE